MTIETTFFDFHLSNSFEDYEVYMNAKEQQIMFKEMRVKTLLYWEIIRLSSEGYCNILRTRKCLIRYFHES